MTRLTDEELASLELAGTSAREDIAEYTTPRGMPTYDDRRIGRMMAREDWVAHAVDAVAEIREHRASQPTLSPDDLAALRVIADLWRARAPNHRTSHENRALAVLDRLLEQSK